MKKIKFFFVMLLCFILADKIMAQDSCNVQIITYFSADCTLTEYFLEMAGLLNNVNVDNYVVQCSNTSQHFTAICENASNYSWSVSGDSSWSFDNEGSSIWVRWGNASDVGRIEVTVLTTDGNYCSTSIDVVLIESPTIASSSIPDYFIEDGEKIIEICQYETISFFDESTSETVPITGNYWTSEIGSDATTENYTIFYNQPYISTIYHYVMNDCGCGAEEKYRIRIKDGTDLKLSCYGTVCGGSQMNYSAFNDCNYYYWSVEGGTIISGQNTPKISVQWHHPESGYGIISLDGFLCGNEICPGQLSKTIPVISNEIPINGPIKLCENQIYLFELPLWGSTSYQWTITPRNVTNPPSNDYIIHPYESANQLMIEFLREDSYTISVEYECDFLNCGPYNTSKQIEVLPVLEIESNNSKICEGAFGLFTNNDNVNVEWKIFKDNVLIYTEYNDSLQYLFSDSGSYCITADNQYYCNQAKFFTEVIELPPAVTSVRGNNIACPNSYLLLESEPTDVQYYLSWEAQCQSANPLVADGNSVTFNYGDNVCSINVYQINQQYGCRSEAYVHQVSPFQLSNTGFPDTLTVCANSFLTLTVPDQSPDVLYEWSVEPEEAIGIQENNTDNTATFIVNYFDISVIGDVHIILKRTFCSDSIEYATLPIDVSMIILPEISFPSPACSGDNVIFYAIGGSHIDNQYKWSINNNILYGDTIFYIFPEGGYYDVQLEYTPFQNCAPSVVTSNIHIRPSPSATVTQMPSESNGDITVSEQINCTYQWSYNGTPLSETSSICPFAGYGNYCCTVTNSQTMCSASNCLLIEDANTGSVCRGINVSESISCTSGTFHVDSPVLPGSLVHWASSPSADINPSYGNYTEMEFYNAGYYDVFASANYNDSCYRGIKTVEILCVPDFYLYYDCSAHGIRILDNSQYRASYSIPSRTFTIKREGSIIGSISMNANTDNIMFPITLPASTTNYTVTMHNSGCELSKYIMIYPTNSIVGMDVPSSVCAGTPVQMNATIQGNPAFLFWNFGDGSYLYATAPYHTYQENPNPYTITLTVADSNNCLITSQASIRAFENDLDGLLKPVGNVVCVGTGRNIVYSPASPPSNYTWSPANITNSINSYTTYATGDYIVRVVNNIGCIDEKMTNVGFYSPPIANISGETDYCEGDSVKLFGNTGSSNSYLWEIEYPDQSTNSFTDPNIVFLPEQSGLYHVTLNVSNDHCSAVTTATVTVHPRPIAPVICYVGDSCIHESDVILGTVNPQQNVFWNNGFYSNQVFIYTPGYTTAYYIDSYGCKSEIDSFLINPAPKYDALLTGCYTKCERDFIDTLSIFRFIPLYKPWKWYYNNNIIQSGMGDSPLLTLPSFGNYHLETNYSPGCIAVSPTLTLDPKLNCGCKDIQVTVLGCNCMAEGCKLFYKVTVNICNLGNNHFCFDELYTNSDGEITSISSLPVSLVPGDCIELSFEFKVLNYSLSDIEFILYDPCTKCEETFSVPLNFEECTVSDCNFDDFSFSFMEDFSSPHQTSYFKFNALIPGNSTGLLAFWSDPPQIVDYYYNPPINLDGILMLNYGQLNQMANNDEEICFHVLVCWDESMICHMTYCILAKEFLELIPQNFRRLNISGNELLPSLDFEITPDIKNEIVQPSLIPNPANDRVIVTGVDPDQVYEITVFSISGEKIKTYNNTIFSVADYSTGTYIVRLITVKHKLYYLKLIKQ